MLLGQFALANVPAGALSIDHPSVERLRQMRGGEIQPVLQSQLRWYLQQLEQAEYATDAGRLEHAARLMRASGSDGYLTGLLSTRTAGLVALPKRFRGDSAIVARLSKEDASSRSTFDQMAPPSELAVFAADGVKLGVAIGELREVPGRDHPIFIRLEPEFLDYDWSTSSWYYRSIAGRILVTPGDGRWVLHTPGGRLSPWQHGLWRALGKAYIRKAHAQLYKDAWESKLAHPARVASAPAGADDTQSEAWLRAVMGWGVNTTIVAPAGYTLSILESNGRGHESFDKTIAQQNEEYTLAIAGQTVTTDGGTGFANADIHKSIRADITQHDADALAYTVNTQILYPWIANVYGEDAVDPGACVEWDVTPPKDRNAEAQALISSAGAITSLVGALAPHGITVDVPSLCTRFGIPVLDKPVRAPLALVPSSEEKAA